MRFILVVAASVLPSCFALALSQSIRDDSDPASLASRCSPDGLTSLNATINNLWDNCTTTCGDGMITATQDALAVYNTTAGNTPTTNDTDQTFLIWAQGNSPEYNNALTTCLTAFHALDQALADEDRSGDQDSTSTSSAAGSSSTSASTKISSTQTSASPSSAAHTSSARSATPNGSPPPTSATAPGPASPTQSGNGAGVLSRSSWLAAFGLTVAFMA